MTKRAGWLFALAAQLCIQCSTGLHTSVVVCTEPHEDHSHPRDCEPEIINALLCTVTNVHKVTVNYELQHDDKQVPHEVCWGCDIDENGIASPEDAAKIRPGRTCGGHPNGCALHKVQYHGHDEHNVTLAFRIMDGSAWSPWSKPEGYYVAKTFNDRKTHMLWSRDFVDFHPVRLQEDDEEEESDEEESEEEVTDL